MTEQTTQDGITVKQIDSTYEVLEVLRENLAESNMGNMAEIVNEAHYLVQKYDEGADWGATYDIPQVGDIVIDPESNPAFGDGRVRVTEVTDKESRFCYIDHKTGKKSVARMNPDHPADAPVVKGRYVSGSDKVYHFPVTRLED